MLKRIQYLLTHITLYISATLLFSISAHALPPEIELDRYLLATEKHIKDEKFETAEVYLLRIQALDQPLPNKYFYYLGTVELQKENYQSAQENLGRYVERAGKTGDFYEDALSQITAAEELENVAQQQEKSTLENNKKQQAFISTVSEVLKTADLEYDNKIKDLYLTSQLDRALVQHINSLLNSAPFTGDRIQKQLPSSGVIYSISTGKRGDIITRKQDQRVNSASRNAQISTYQLNVYGRDFLVDYLCSIDSASCWINKPDGHGKWIEIAYDESTAMELKKALSRLIKVLQAG